MICSICRRAAVRPPACCDKCGRLACGECMKRFSEPGVYELRPGKDYRVVTTQRNTAPKIVIRELCKVCRAETTLTEDSHGGALPR